MNLREAAGQALEALQIWQDSLTDPSAMPGWRFAVVGEKAIANLRAALAEDAMQRLTDVQQEMEATCQESRQVEPVAWATVGFVTWGNRQIEKVDKLTREAQPEYGFVIPLYAAPPKRKPLTDAEIKRLYDSLPSKYTLAMFARAIERAHGIGGEE